MADLELQGTIILNSDTKEVKKDVEKLSKESGEKTGTSFAEAIGKAIKQHAGSTGGSIIGATIGGGGKGGIGAAIGAAAGGGGLGGIAAAAGPVGIAAAIVASLAVAIKKVIEAFVDLVKQLVAFGRSLAEASAAMATNFARFDLEILKLKKQVGDELAPAFGVLLRSISDLAREVLPAFVVALKIATIAVSWGVKAAPWILSPVGAAFMQSGAGKSLISKLNQWLDLQIGGNNLSSNVVTDFQAFINDEKSLQVKEANRISEDRRQRNRALREGVEAIDFRLRVAQ